MSTDNTLTISTNDLAVPRTQYNVMTDDGNVSVNYGSGIAVIRGIDTGLMLGFAFNNLNAGAQNISLLKGDIYYTFNGTTYNFMKVTNEFGYVIGNVSLNLLSGATDLTQFNSGDGRGWNMFPWAPKF